MLEDGEAIRGRLQTARSSRWTRPVTPSTTWPCTTPLSGVLFAGDAVGVKLPDAGVLRPSTPPPDFDLSRPSIRSSASPTGSRPRLALAHYGLLDDPLDVLDEAGGTLRKWADVAESAFRNGRGHRRRSGQEFESDLDGVAAEHREKLEVMNGVHSNAAGLQRWLTTRPPVGDPKGEGP